MIIRNVATTILLVTVIPFCNRGKLSGKMEDPGFFSGDTLKCAIALGDDMYGSEGLKTGFNYELLKRFAASHGKQAVIRTEHEGENYIDSLKNGDVDIVVLPATDTASGIMKSRQVDNDALWAVNSGKICEIKKINLWASTFIGSSDYTDMRHKFYNTYNPYKRLEQGVTSRRISPYDEIIKQQAGHLGWDWRMLAAVIYQESKFSINSRSVRGAFGLMQMMPSTAEYYGATDLLDPEQNIMTGTKHLARLQRIYSNLDQQEKIKFTLAAYNAGEGRIQDCRNFASIINADNTRWDEIVKIIPKMQDDSILQLDTVKFGKFKGTETINYVDSVLAIYGAFCEICPSI